LAGIDAPKHVEGKSLRPLLVDPKAKWDDIALTTHGYMNHAVRSARWRYIRYADEIRSQPYDAFGRLRTSSSLVELQQWLLKLAHVQGILKDQP
jgi:hypothetical protein